MLRFTFFFCSLITSLFALPTRQEIKIGRNDQLIYYLETPKPNRSYPIAIVIEGSYDDWIGPQSILRLHKKVSSPFLNSGIGILTMEKRGVDGKKIDLDYFHQFNKPSQRLFDHFLLVEHLKNHPPTNWDGQLIVIGGSEGGPIAIKLAHKVDPCICAAIVGCGSTTFKEYIWTTIQSIQSAPFLKKKFINWWCDLPKTRVEYERKCDEMKINPDPNKKWFGQTFLYWSDALEQEEAKELLELQCPTIVISGTEDIECSSTDRLMETAKYTNQNISYRRIEGMDHNALNPKWNVLNILIDFIKNISPLNKP